MYKKEFFTLRQKMELFEALQDAHLTIEIPKHRIIMIDLLLHYLTIRRLTFKKKRLILIGRKIASTHNYNELVQLCRLYDKVKDSN